MLSTLNTKDSVKALGNLKIKVEKSVHEMKEEALKTALKLVEKKHKRVASNTDRA